jgi:hypothetical protein
MAIKFGFYLSVSLHKQGWQLNADRNFIKFYIGRVTKVCRHTPAFLKITGQLLREFNTFQFSLKLDDKNGHVALTRATR